NRRQLPLLQRMPEVSQEDDVQALGAEVHDRNLVPGQPFGRLEDRDRPDLDAQEFGPGRRDLEGAKRLEWRHELAEMAVVSVILVADDDEVRGLVDRLISPAVGGSIGVQDDPGASCLDPEGRVTVPGDSHGDLSLVSRAFQPDADRTGPTESGW